MADWLALAATPVFAIMAAMAIFVGDGSAICSVMPASPLNGMAAMYVLMSVFHAAPWLKRISSRR